MIRTRREAERSFYLVKLPVTQPGSKMNATLPKQPTQTVAGLSTTHIIGQSVLALYQHSRYRPDRLAFS